MKLEIRNYVRLAEPRDIPILIKFIRKFVSSSPYKTMKFDSERLRVFFKNIIEGVNPTGIVLVALKDGNPIGCIVGAYAEPVFSSDKVSTELGWWIEPEYRKTKASLYVFDAYEDWARRVGCSYVQSAYLPGISPSLDRFYQRRGYRQVESSFLKTLRLKV